MAVDELKSRKAELLRCVPELAEAAPKELVRISRLFEEITVGKGKVLTRELRERVLAAGTTPSPGGTDGA